MRTRGFSVPRYWGSDCGRSVTVRSSPSSLETPAARLSSPRACASSDSTFRQFDRPRSQRARRDSGSQRPRVTRRAIPSARATALLGCSATGLAAAIPGVAIPGVKAPCRTHHGTALLRGDKRGEAGEASFVSRETSAWYRCSRRPARPSCRLTEQVAEASSKRMGSLLRTPEPTIRPTHLTVGAHARAPTRPARPQPHWRTRHRASPRSPSHRAPPPRARHGLGVRCLPRSSSVRRLVQQEQHRRMNEGARQRYPLALPPRVGSHGAFGERAHLEPLRGFRKCRPGISTMEPRS